MVLLYHEYTDASVQLKRMRKVRCRSQIEEVMEWESKFNTSQLRTSATYLFLHVRRRHSVLWGNVADDIT